MQARWAPARKAHGQRHDRVGRVNGHGRSAEAAPDHAAVASILRDRPDGFRRTARLEEIWTEMKLQPGVFGASGGRICRGR